VYVYAEINSEEYAMYSIESHPTFQRNTYPYSGQRISQAINQRENTLQRAWLDLFFDPGNGGDIFFRNAGCLSTEYAALHPRR
jgi:hypothetical protein